MFLATNEFTWLVNTALTPLDPEECKTKPPTKMTKALQEAYKIATEGHDLSFYKKVLTDFEVERAKIDEENQRLAEVAEAKAAAKAEKEAADETEGKEKKKKSRKSKALDDEDVEMDDAAEAPKSSKKRKKQDDSDGEGAKTKKTPKVTKINAPKTPNGETPSSKKASTSKPKKKVTAPKVEEETTEEKKELTEAEKLEQREKAILYLRHRLQKGFLSRDQAPKEDEMSGMAEFFSQLEKYENLEPSIIRTTKIHKVLKAIVKLAAIPKDEEFSFKKRSTSLLEIWNKRMEADGEAAPTSVGEDKTPATNGDAAAAASEEPADAKEGSETKEGAEKTEEEAEKKADALDEKIEEKAEAKGDDKADEKAEEEAEKTEEKAVDVPMADAAEPATAPVEKTDVGNDAQDEAADGDVSMATAPEEQTEPAAAA